MHTWETFSWRLVTWSTINSFLQMVEKPGPLGTVRELRKERLAMASLRGGDHRGWHEPDVQARTPHRARACRACTRPSASFSVVSRLLGRRADLRLLRFAPAQRATPSFKGGAGGASYVWYVVRYTCDT